MKRMCLCYLGLWVMTVFLIMFEWLLRYLVVECTTKSVLSFSGRWLVGVANVLLTTIRVCVVAMIVAMSIMFSLGLVGDLI